MSHLKKGFVWRKVEVNDNFINVKCGFNAEFEFASQHSVRNVKYFASFCNAPWFLKGVGGKHTHKGDLKAVIAMSEIRRRFHDDAAIQNSAAAAADAELEEEKPAEKDRMNILEELDEPTPKPKAKAKEAKLRHFLRHYSSEHRCM